LRSAHSEEERVLPQHHFRTPVKKVANAQPTRQEAPQQRQPETDRYHLEIDRQTKRLFKTSEAARTAALEIKARFPALQVSVFDSTNKSRTMVDVSKSS
jgi:hypothetical protein